MPFGANDEVLFGEADEVLDAPERTPAGGGGPQRGRKYVTSGERMYRDTMAAARGQAGARAGALDLAVNSVVNAPADVANSAARLLATGAGRMANALGFDNTWEQDARDESRSFGRVPLLTDAGTTLAGNIGEAMPDFIKNMDPAIGDLLNVGGAGIGGRATGLLPKGPVLNEFSRNVAHNRGAAPYQQSPVADVAQRYTVVPEDVQHSAGMPTTGNIRGSTRASLGPDVTGSEVPVANIRKATANAVSDMPAPGGLLDANGRVDAGLLRRAMDEQSVPYQQVAQLPAPQANTLAGRLRQAWEARGGSLKGDAVAESRLLPLMDEAGAPLPTSELLSRWKEINGYAASLRKQVGEGSAAAQIKSGDLRLIADAILDEVDSRAAAFGNPQLTESLKQARVNLGRLHSLEDALDTVGWVDPAKLKAMGERGVPLSGGLAQVAADVAAAPRSLRPMQSAINAQDSALDQFGRQPNSWLRNVAGHMGGNWLARRGVDSLNRELRAGTGVLRQPVPETPVPLLYGPNEGPAPLMGPQGPGPNSPWAGPLSLAPEPPAGIPLNRFEAPQGRQLAEGAPPFLLEGQSPNAAPLQAFADDLLPWEAPGDVPPLRGPVQSFSEQLGPVSDPLMLPEAPGMPDRPRGVSGPRSAQLGGRSPRDFPLLPDDEPGPLGPLFGPGDEFPPPAAPVLPQGPAPGGAGGDVVNFDDLSLARELGVNARGMSGAQLADAIDEAGPNMAVENSRRLDPDYAAREAEGRALWERLGQRNVPGGAGGGAAFADELTLADTGPAALRVDVTESLPSQGSALFADDFLLPGARRVESPAGFVDLLETPDGALQIKRTKTAPGQEGRGFGQERLLNAAREAQAQGKPLNSDVEVNPDARRLYEKLREKGQLEFDGPFDDGGPVFRNIRPAGGVSDLLGD